MLGKWIRLEEIRLFGEFPNSADPVERPRAFLQFITMKGTELRRICSLDAFLKIIFLSFLLYLTTTGERHGAGVLGPIQIQDCCTCMVCISDSSVLGSPGLLIFYYQVLHFRLSFKAKQTVLLISSSFRH